MTHPAKERRPIRRVGTCLTVVLAVACDSPQSGPLGVSAERFTIEGFIYYDLNANGGRDPGERGLDRFRVFLDQNGDGLLDDGERSTSTNVDGEFRFTDLLPEASYTVTQALPPGWTSTGLGPTPTSALDGLGPQRIVGGVDASAGEFPGVVAVLDPAFTPAFEAVYCGGMLVSGRWVLTAAGCVVEGGVITLPDVLLGTHDIESGARLKPRRVLVHPDYDEGTTAYNVALIELGDVVLERRTLAFDAVPVALVEAGSTLTAVGWGAVTPDGEYFYTTLQKAALPVIPNGLCEEVYGGITPDMLCAGGAPGIGSCYYDDGSGLFADVGGAPVLVGVASWSGVDDDGNCAAEGLPSGWTRVASVDAFLRQYVLPERSRSVTVAGEQGRTKRVEFGNFR